MIKPAPKCRIGTVALLLVALLVSSTLALHETGLRHSKLQLRHSHDAHQAHAAYRMMTQRRQLQQATATAGAGGASASAGATSAMAGSSGASASAGGSAAAASTSTYLALDPTSSTPASPSSDSGADLLQDVFKTIEAALKAFPELSIFLKIVEEVLGSKIKEAETILTLLCPTNAAFEALASTLGKTIEELLSSPIIKKIILYHILPEVEEVAEFAIGEFIQTLLSGAGIKVNVVKAITQILPTGGPPASIIEKDIKAGEAILQIIGGVLIPTSEVQALEALLQVASNIVEDSGEATPSAGGK